MPKLKNNYGYCNANLGNNRLCIHRRGCRRFLGNYSLDQLANEFDNLKAWIIKAKECADSKPLPYDMLDRFKDDASGGRIV